MFLDPTSYRSQQCPSNDFPAINFRAPSYYLYEGWQKLKGIILHIDTSILYKTSLTDLPSQLFFSLLCMNKNTGFNKHKIAQ